jgi:hypothetical protein
LSGIACLRSPPIGRVSPPDGSTPRKRSKRPLIPANAT